MNARLERWWELKPMLKQRFSQLSDDDLMYERGKEQELLLRLHTKTGKSTDDMQRIINSLQVAYLHNRLL
ncbi:general stress protein CsbD [Chitinophaga pendula]|uniref:hypothetical protein n=1 Tax=Chitinophaga TaxID=79328 RepID=UPI000BB074C8|nr:MULTISPECIES: hypothetical protein [Chitinophaga]ASZ14809.1 hypothetical protein CK934_05105 [Chitinophaga sp. MD30]UCJ06631.1 general stress protein CsbD [Chitinophaga pendula]